MSMIRPYQVGFGGHSQRCECAVCVPRRIKAFKVWYQEQSHLPTMPDQTRTVFVRPHWRRQPNHLNKMPKFKKALIKTFLEA